MRTHGRFQFCCDLQPRSFFCYCVQSQLIMEIDDVKGASPTKKARAGPYVDAVDKLLMSPQLNSELGIPFSSLAHALVRKSMERMNGVKEGFTMLGALQIAKGSKGFIEPYSHSPAATAVSETGRHICGFNIFAFQPINSTELSICFDDVRQLSEFQFPKPQPIQKKTHTHTHTQPTLKIKNIKTQWRAKENVISGT